MEQIETQDFMNGLAFKVDEILTALNTYFEGFDNTRIITLVLLLLAIALFFFSVVVVSIRHIISIIKSNNPAKNIKKECIIDGDTITLKLVDLRDNYVYEDALGDIGSVYISKDGMMIYVELGYEEKIEKLREAKIYQELKKIFGTEEFNPLSDEYYNKIKMLISNKTLESLGYTISNEQEYDTEITFKHRKH